MKTEDQEEEDGSKTEYQEEGEGLKSRDQEEEDNLLETDCHEEEEDLKADDEESLERDDLEQEVSEPGEEDTIGVDINYKAGEKSGTLILRGASRAQDSIRTVITRDVCMTPIKTTPLFSVRYGLWLRNRLGNRHKYTSEWDWPGLSYHQRSW